MAYNLKHFYSSRPPSVERPFVRPPTIHQSDDLKHQRNRSLGPFNNKSIVSEKIPITFSPAGIKLHPYPSATLETENKIHLYSEVERLSILNYELKKQNEGLTIELEQVKTFVGKVPDLEAIIHELQQEVAFKNESVNQAIKDQECLKIDNIHLSKLEPAYHELLDHNRALIAEVDNLDIRLKELLAERDVLEAHGESIKILKPRLEDATRRIELMDRDLTLKDQELIDYRARIQDLTTRLNALSLENEQINDLSVEQARERDLLRARIDELERLHEERIHDIKTQMEATKKVHIEYERVELTEKFNLDLAKKDEELAQAKKYIENLEQRLMVANKEADHLQKWNVSKAGDIDELTMRIAQLEEEREELKRVIEIEACLKTEKQLAQQKTEYETIILQLRQEINELERLKVVVRQRENEIEVLKAQSNNNERVWELRLHQTVENEVKSANNKFLLEKSVLEGEVSSTKDQISSLENQVTYLNMEVERLIDIQSQKSAEISELQRKSTTQEMNFRLALDEQKTKLEIEKKQSLEEQRRELEKIHQAKVDEMKRFQTILEEKTYTLLDENKRLSSVSEERRKELESVTLQLKITEDLHKQELGDNLRKSQFTQRMNIEKEVANISAKHREDKTELEVKLSMSINELEKLKAHCEAQDNQIDWLSRSVRDKDLELQQEKRKYVELEIQRTRDINEIREQVDSYKKANVDVNTLQVRFEAEKSALVSQISQHKEKVNEMEKRLLLFIGENEKMRDLYNDKSNELEVLKQKYRGLEERWYDEKANLENENENLKRSNLDIKEMSIRFASDKSQYENQLKQLKIINENGKQELEKLYDLMNQRKKEQDYYLKQNEDLKREAERLTRLVREVDLESSTKKDRYAGMERTISELERDRDLYKQHADRLNSQLQQTYAELQEKIMELDIAKRKYDESVMKLSSQLDKDLMNKMMGNSMVGTSKLGKINVTPGKSDRGNISRSEF